MKMKLHAWPGGLVGQVAVVLLLAVLLESVGSAFSRERSDLAASRGDQARHLAEHVLVVDAALSALPIEARASRARALSTQDVRVYWERPPAVAAGAPSRLLEHFQRKMVYWRPALEDRDLRLSRTAGGFLFAPQQLEVALRLKDGSWARLKTELAPQPWTVTVSGLGSAVILTLGVLTASGLMLRALGAPLRALTEAAERVGLGERVHVPEEGPRDLRHVAQAFNAMQGRIADLTRARVEALAAVSHDLRTPLSRLGLRIEGIDNDEMRRAAESDISEMTGMLDSLLGYLRGDDPEPPRACDLAAMAMTVVDDATDRGGQAVYVGPDHLVATVRPLAVKRALVNLVDNAVIYGRRARVILEGQPGKLIIAIEDEGPGIAPDMIQRALEPFQRLDGARARNTSGMGLGLSIVAAIVRDEGGELSLSNRPEGGLRAEIKLDRTA